MTTGTAKNLILAEGEEVTGSVIDIPQYSSGGWTPIDASGAGLTITNLGSFFIKLNDIVFIVARFQYPVNSNGSASAIGGLPYSVGASISNIVWPVQGVGTPAFEQNFVPEYGTSYGYFRSATAGTNPNSTQTGKTILISGFYITGTIAT